MTTRQVDFKEYVLKDQLKFMLAGRAVFTVLNTETKNRFTFKIKKLAKEKIRGNNRLWFVRVLTAPDNSNDKSFSFLGTIFQNEKKPMFYKQSEKSRISSKARSQIVWSWFFENLCNQTLPEQIEVFHEGQCGRCGRSLTNPTSIMDGFGPECVTKIGEK